MATILMAQAEWFITGAWMTEVARRRRPAMDEDTGITHQCVGEAQRRYAPSGEALTFCAILIQYDRAHTRRKMTVTCLACIDAEADLG